MHALRRWVVGVLAKLFSDQTAKKAARWMSSRLVEQLRKQATDDFVELLLRALDLAFCADREFRKNIDRFDARYQIATADHAVDQTVVFHAGDMELEPSSDHPPDVEVLFTDAKAIRQYLFSEQQDILDSVLNNAVQVKGNVNYVYKLGFLARELEWRLGLLQ